MEAPWGFMRSPAYPYDIVRKYWHIQVRRIDTATLVALAKTLHTTNVELLKEVMGQEEGTPDADIYTGA